ncbi:hypothetical protein ACJZ2D_000787 [Fusarium nematophilum]
MYSHRTKMDYLDASEGTVAVPIFKAGPEIASTSALDAVLCQISRGRLVSTNQGTHPPAEGGWKKKEES